MTPSSPTTDHRVDVTSRRIEPLSALKASLIFVAIASSAFLLWKARDGVLLIFAAAMLALLLRVISGAISRWTRLPVAISLLISVLAIGALVLLTSYLFGTHVAAEFSDVFHRATTGWNDINQRLLNTPFAGLGHKIEEHSTPMIGSSVREGFSMLTEVVEALIVLVISAIYLAAEPGTYRGGVIKLFNPELRHWADGNIETLGRTMKLWLYGRLLTMLLVGVLACFATWLIGVPGPIALGLIAFIAEAIPYLGAFLGGIPALLVATTKGGEAALFTIGAYLLIHLIEGYLVSPLIQRRFVAIPPALMLFGITITSLLFQAPGLIVAAPLTVAIFSIVRIFFADRDRHLEPDRRH